MPYATNPHDGTQLYFEDDGGEGDPVVLYGGILDSVDLVRESKLARALPPDEFRLVFADHRGLGRSDKPHRVACYAIELRVGDAVVILDELSIDRAHFIGTSYGGRLCFAIGELVPGRVLSLVVGGQHPYAMRLDGPLGSVIPDAMAASRRERTLEPFLRVLEDSTGSRFPSAVRIRYLENDPVAVAAASDAMLSDGDIASELHDWRMPCLIFVGAGDEDFIALARRAAEEIPRAELVIVEDADHVAAHSAHNPIIPAMLHILREGRRSHQRNEVAPGA